MKRIWIFTLVLALINIAIGIILLVNSNIIGILEIICGLMIGGASLYGFFVIEKLQKKK